MKIRVCHLKDTDIIFNLVQDTIDRIYPHYYPSGAVSFMKHYHKREQLEKEIENGDVYLSEEDGIAVATGSTEGNGIKRLFVAPEHQGKGYGSHMMDFLEEVVAKRYASAVIDASLPAYELYLKRGYRNLKYHTAPLRGGDVLCYYEMEKVFNKQNTGGNYNNLLFRSIENSGNGEVSETTVFHYHQQGNIVWADYHGGEIAAGVLVGTSDEHGELDFRYRHYNLKNEMRAGICHSVPERTEHGKLRLRESWEWTEGGSGKGTSVIEETE